MKVTHSLIDTVQAAGELYGSCIFSLFLTIYDIKTHFIVGDHECVNYSKWLVGLAHLQVIYTWIYHQSGDISYSSKLFCSITTFIALH